MARKLLIPPEGTSYSVQPGVETLATKLDGGASRFRRDILDAASTVDCNWILDPQEYNYLAAFYRTGAGRGALPFHVELIIDTSLPQTYSAHFIPGTFQLTQQRGHAYFVAAQLEVVPLRVLDRSATDDAIMDAYEASLIPPEPVPQPPIVPPEPPGPVVPESAMLWGDGEPMQWSDGDYIEWGPPWVAP